MKRPATPSRSRVPGRFAVRCASPPLAIAARPLPLTAREREIAERLTVSVRTVEGHLYRAGLKLGVSERAALADVLGVE